MSDKSYFDLGFFLFKYLEVTKGLGVLLFTVKVTTKEWIFENKSVFFLSFDFLLKTKLKQKINE